MKTSVRLLAPSLMRWYERQKRVLPWRETPEVYRVWVSEIMLQQTQVITVIPYFERFIARFPDVAALARAEIDEVLQSWSGLGYYTRARNIHLASRQIVAKGRFPSTREEWLEIPGIGPYTAGAICSIALNQPEPILDGNVERVLSRVKRWGRERKKDLWILSAEWVREAHRLGVRPSAFNQALMELGAMVCTPKKPNCSQCPFGSSCEGRLRGDALDFPKKNKKAKPIQIQEESFLLIDEAGRVLLEQSPQGNWRRGLWDLPTADPGLTKSAKKLGELKTHHVVTRHRITRRTQVFSVKKSSSIKAHQGRWVGFPELVNSEKTPPLPIGSALRKSVREAVRKFLPRI